MLIRVSGKLTDNTPFSMRVESPSALEAVASTGVKLAAAGKTNVSSISAAPVGEAQEVYFGEAKTAEQIAAAKLARAEKKAAKQTAELPAATPVAPNARTNKR